MRWDCPGQLRCTSTASTDPRVKRQCSRASVGPLEAAGSARRWCLLGARRCRASWGAQGLDVDPDIDVRVVLGRDRQLEVAAHDDRVGIGKQLYPVSWLFGGAEDDLVAAVVVDFEVAVVDIAKQRAGHGAIIGDPMHGERGVALLLERAEAIQAVRAFGAWGRW